VIAAQATGAKLIGAAAKSANFRLPSAALAMTAANLLTETLRSPAFRLSDAQRKASAWSRKNCTNRFAADAPPLQSVDVVG
jgi:hypothetical protein